MAASSLLLSSAYKASVFSEINPILQYFISLKILPTERPTGRQSKKKKSSIRLWASISFYFEGHTHLGHLFA